MKASTGRLVCVVLVTFCLGGGLAEAQSTLEPNARLAGLGKVWGLLKYHPKTTTQSNWDDALVGAIPRFLAASTGPEFNQEVMNLLRQAGQAYAFRSVPAEVSALAVLNPAVKWIDDDSAFDAPTKAALKDVVLSYQRKPNAYVARAASGNPDFASDIAYNAGSGSLPAEEIRLLALFRYWNMVQYYDPCNNLMDRDWNDVLLEMVPVFRRASTAVDYHLAVARLTASISDGHASTSSTVLTGYWGSLRVPLQLRLIEGRTTVTRVYASLPAGADIRVGDVVTHIDGVSVEDRRSAMRALVHGSNEGALEKNIHTYLVGTNEPQATLSLDRGGETLKVVVTAYDAARLNSVIAAFDAEHSKLFTILDGNVGYVHMGLLQRADVPTVMNQLKNTRAIVFDLRNYPNTTLYDVLNYLNSSAKPFAKFTQPDFNTQPGTFSWTSVLTAGSGSANAWYSSFPPYFNYAGRVALLVNQETLSQAEYTAMAFRTVAGSTLVGSQTAGADGNISLISLPGGLSTYFSGLGVFYPDGRPTQRVGIVPDVLVTPTIAGLRAGSDEVLEAALALLR